MKKGATSADELASSAANAEEQLEHRAEENEMVRIIGALPESQREVMRLKFQDGFSYKEISSITGHSVSYVGVLIHEAMTRLRRELASGTTALRQGGGR